MCQKFVQPDLSKYLSTMVYTSEQEKIMSLEI